MNAGKGFAWAGFALGTVVSVAANVTHAATGDWSPAELVGAAFWPIALMLSVEILTRRDSSRDHWLKSVGLGLGLVVVAGVAAFLSYMHMAGLLVSWGEAAWSAHLGPLAVDGLMLVSGLALLPDRDRQLEVIDHRHVFTWPDPIGPQEHPVLRYARQAQQLAATAYAGPPAFVLTTDGSGADPLAFLGDLPMAKRGGMRYPVDNQLADPPADDPMLDRILAGIPDEPQIILQEGDRRHVGYDVPIGPAPGPVPKPVKRAPEQRPKPKAKAAKARSAEPDPARVEEAYRYWQSNPEATGVKIAEIAGVGRATGYRYVADWKAAPIGVSQ